MNRYLTLALLGLTLLAGCKKCEGFNPFDDYQRTDPIDGDWTEDVKVDPERGRGAFRVIIYKTDPESDDETIKKALNAALSAAGGGSADQLSDNEVDKLLREFATGAGGPYNDRAFRIKRYEVTVKADNLDLMKPMRVKWKYDTGANQANKAKQIDYNPMNPGDAPTMTVLDRGSGEYGFVFTQAALLRVDGPKVKLSRGGGYSLDGTPFEVTVDGQPVQYTLVPESQLLEVEDLPFLIYEVKGFSGDLSTLMCELCRERQHPVPNDEALWAKFTMNQTYVWVDGASGRSGAETQVVFTLTINDAGGMPQEVKAKVGGMTFDSMGEDQESNGNRYSLSADYDPDSGRATIRFLLKPKEPLATTEACEFKFTINGTPFTERASQSNSGGQ
jgi:hypothetical protein